MEPVHHKVAPHHLWQGVSGESFWGDSFGKGLGGLLICLGFEGLGLSGLEWGRFGLDIGMSSYSSALDIFLADLISFGPD